MEKLIKAGHLRRYVREIDQGPEPRQDADSITTSVAAPPEHRPTINYILGGPSDDQYQTKHQQNRLFRVATIKARVNAIRMGSSRVEIEPIDGPKSFPPVNLDIFIVPHYDALVLTLYINGFDVHRVLVDPGSVADLLQLPAFRQMKLSSEILNSARRILSRPYLCLGEERQRGAARDWDSLTCFSDIGGPISFVNHKEIKLIIPPP